MTAMTAGEVQPRRAPAGGPARVLNVARLQTVPWRSALLWPWGIMGIAFAINLALFTVLDDQGVDDPTTGGVSSIYVVMAVAAYQVVQKDFAFALSMGVTRRTFALATAGLALVQGAAYGAVLLLLRGIEVATGGWGISLEFFGPDFLRVGNPVGQWLVYTAYFVCVAGLGWLPAAVAKRWGGTGTMALLAVLVAVVGGIITLATWLDWWGPIGDALGGLPRFVLYAGAPAVLGVLLAAATYAVLRRTSP